MTYIFSCALIGQTPASSFQTDIILLLLCNEGQSQVFNHNFEVKYTIQLQQIFQWMTTTKVKIFNAIVSIR